MNNYFIKVWTIPIILGILTIVGLLVALVGTDKWHFVSWLFLSVPLIVMVKYLFKLKSRS